MNNENDKDELEFDPSESEEFLSNLDAAIGIGGEEDGYSADDISMDEDVFAGVNAALAEQIEQEFGKEEAAHVEKKPNKFLEIIKGIPTWTKILVSVILVILLSVGLLFGTPAGRDLVYNMLVEFAFGKVVVDPEEPTPTIAPVETPSAAPTETPITDPNTTPGAEATPEPTPEPTIAIKDDENVINVLLLGEESIYGSSRGRTDAIILVSIDLRGGDLKMVSFLRDLYVRIPGRADDRLNASFAYGGPKLIVETIENNFKVDIDGYVKVNFSGFMDVIDQLGGLRISLTAQESEYLNTTGYISNVDERNTVAGYQNMTGSQVLGYCRVRYVPTANGLKDDFGRNYRHRVVLQALFDKYKEKGFSELLSVMNTCFQYVTVSEGLKEVAADCLQSVIEKKMFNIEQMQIPKSGHYGNAIIDGKDVITFYPDNIDILQDFLYEEEE